MLRKRAQRKSGPRGKNSVAGVAAIMDDSKILALNPTAAAAR
ncbi:MAG TPA: hypothetical protein VJS43_06055 [Candidatus Acidoferrales bacterium]|nr:hypothetical protein [Candidatus Acidoferrales bacterium]